MPIRILFLVAPKPGFGGEHVFAPPEQIRSATTYLVPLEAPLGDAQTGTDHLITKLDLQLDLPNW